MLARARQEYLLRQISLYGTVRASEAADELGVTQVTIRRDISQLETDGLVQRVHGGAVAAQRKSTKPRPARTLIGVVVPSATFYYPDVIAGMESVAAELGVRIVLGISDYRPEAERSQVERLLALGVKGLVLTPTLHEQVPADIAAWLESIPVPVVVLERDVGASRAVRELDSVRTDHRHGGLLAVDHFARLGHRSVVLAATEATPTAPAIREGYHQAVAQLGLDPVPAVTLPSDHDDPADLTAAIEEFIEHRHDLGARAVLAHSDRHAIRIVEVAQLRGLRIPEELAVISYDDVVAGHGAVPLTAIAPPRRELGREALRLIDRRLRTEAEQEAPRHSQLLPRLTVRESCGAEVEG